MKTGYESDHVMDRKPLRNLVSWRENYNKNLVSLEKGQQKNPVPCHDGDYCTLV